MECCETEGNHRIENQVAQYKKKKKFNKRKSTNFKTKVHGQLFIFKYRKSEEINLKDIFI